MKTETKKRQTTKAYGKVKVLTKPVRIHGYDEKTGNVVVLEDAADIDNYIKDKCSFTLERPTYEYFYKEYDVNAELVNVGTTTERYERSILFTWDGKRRMQNHSKWFASRGYTKIIRNNVSLKDAAMIVAKAKGFDSVEARLETF